MPQRDAATVDIRLAEVIATLSLATDLAMGQPPQYALHSCVLAVRLGQALKLDAGQLSDIFYLTLLRFAGCTADSPLAAATFGNELSVRAWMATVDYARPSHMLLALIRNLGSGEPPLQRGRALVNAFVLMPKLMGTAASHCQVAQRLSERLGLGTQIEGALAHIYERWDGKGMPNGVKGEDVALSARVVSLAQDAEIFHRMGGVEAAVAVVNDRAGKTYDPAMVECFCSQAKELLAETDSRRFLTEPDTRHHATLEMFTPSFVAHTPGVPVPLGRIAFAQFADAFYAAFPGGSRQPAAGWQ